LAGKFDYGRKYSGKIRPLQIAGFTGSIGRQLRRGVDDRLCSVPVPLGPVVRSKWQDEWRKPQASLDSQHHKGKFHH
jgi:hypothetical protein